MGFAMATSYVRVNAPRADGVPLLPVSVKGTIQKSPEPAVRPLKVIEKAVSDIDTYQHSIVEGKSETSRWRLVAARLNLSRSWMTI